VTICIGTICRDKDQHPLIVGASDRLLVVGGMKSEPFQTKVAQLSDKVAAMISGTVPTCTTILQDALLQVSELDKNSILVRDVARICARAFARCRRAEAESLLLTPLSLSASDLTHPDERMSPYVLDKCIQEMRKYELEAELMVVGIDKLGAHIYVIENPGYPHPQDDIGYAIIGSGGWHAKAYLMSMNYTNSWPLQDSLFVTHAAKRRAESDIYVGTKTDMFIIAPQLPYAPLPVEIISELDTNYDQAKVKKDKIELEAFQLLKTYLEKTFPSTTPPSAAPSEK